MAPSPEIPPVVHHGDGQVMSFWRYLSPVAGTARRGHHRSMLRDLHAELRDYPALLPFLDPLEDIPAFLARPQPRSRPAGRRPARLRPADRPASPARGQSLLGDAGSAT